MFNELSGYETHELLGNTHRVVNSGYHPKSFFQDMWAQISSGEVWRGEICNRSKLGPEYWVDTTIVPFVGDNGKIEKYVSIRYDITSRKKAEEQVTLERRKLLESEKMASLGLISAGIAHELGNPLGAIRGRLEMLLDACKAGEVDLDFAQTSIDKTIKSVDRMSKIIRALKNFSRDGTRDEMQEFDLVELVDDIVELSAQKCVKAGVRVEFDRSVGPVTVLGRETDIGQVIVNLFNNAIDAIRDQERPWLKLEVTSSDSEVQLKVLDSGSGVPADLRAKIFDPFFTTKEVGKGTGLGLSLCRSFVEQHGGSLTYKMDRHGSCFLVTLPRS